MRKMTLFLALLFGSATVFAQNPSLSKSDFKDILQLCIDIPQLQAHIPADAEGQIKQLYVYYYAPQFIPTDIVLTKGGKSLPFREITNTENDISESFFLFEQLDIDKGIISFKFTKNADGIRTLVKVTGSIQKINSKWVINATTVNVQ